MYKNSIINATGIEDPTQKAKAYCHIAAAQEKRSDFPGARDTVAFAKTVVDEIKNPFKRSLCYLLCITAIYECVIKVEIKPMNLYI